MNITEKYNLKIKYNQFAQEVSSNFEDPDEKILIDSFEKYVLELKNKNKEKYSMIELGSNFSYYSMLFKKIIEPNETLSIMVEPYEKFFNTGKEHFEINNLEGNFLKKRIYNPELWCNIKFDYPSTGIDELLDEYKIEELDVLHCDIDQSEVLALNTASNSLKNKKIDLLFILTHGKDQQEVSNPPTPLHVECKNILNGYGYDCLLDHPTCDVCGDGLLIFKK